MHKLTLSISLVCALAACSGDTTDPTDPDAGTDGTDSETAAQNEFHPNVPEEFKFLWNTETPCTRRGGRRGTRVYRMLYDGVIGADGAFTAKEKWFWFKGDKERWDEDVVDSLEYNGAASQTWDGAALECVSCEEVYEAARTVVDNPSDTGYSKSVVFALDTLNFNGEFNEDQKMQVMYARYRDDELTNLNTDYARGFMFPDDDTPGSHPATFNWVGEGCY